jgi:hypothetical protein
MESEIYNRLISSKNIYLSLYSINSSSLEEYLLSKDDYVEYQKLIDKFNTNNIYLWVEKIKIRIDELLNPPEGEEKYFTAKVYFNPKNENSFRPIHTASLLDQLTMICMLNILIYDVDDNEIKISEMGNLLPHNFYGNRIEKNPRSLFKPWVKQYKKYSDDANNLLKKYRDNSDYKYELVLDLQNFFPSINPCALYNYIVSLVPLYYSNQEKEFFKKIIEKLIFIKVDNLIDNDDKKNYYGNFLKEPIVEINKKNSEDKKIFKKLVDNSFSLGLPQGLPHTYFFANLFMVEISKIYKDVLCDSNMIFYVDDSIIYTNGWCKKIGDSKTINFGDKVEDQLFIDEVNFEIEKLVSKFSSINSFMKEKHVVDDRIYKVKVHPFKDNNAKSFYSRISDYSEGEININKLGRQISYFSVNQYKSFDEESDNIMNIKALGLLELIDNEISRFKKINSESKSTYKDKLLRARKFLLNRTKLLKYLLDGDKIGIINNFERELDTILVNDEISKTDNKELNHGKINSESTSLKKAFCESYKNSTLACDFKYIVSDSLKYNSDITSVLNKLVVINDKLFINKNHTSSYIYKLISIAKDNKYIKSKITCNDSYNSLISSVKYKLGLNYGKSAEKKLKYLDHELNNLFTILQNKDDNYIVINKNKFLDSYIKDLNISNFVFSEVSAYINYNSDEIFRMLLNTIISSIMEIEITDDFIFCKKNHMLITYFDLRMLVYLRSKDFKISGLKNHFDDCRKKEFEKIVEYSIFQVLQIFQKYIQDSKRIDTLILTHKYTCDIWKNGSKQLYFYTLHNQEHAIELIKNSIKLTKAIDLMQIKKFDYYILFLACYLHDISMVTMPDYNQFQKENLKSDFIFKEFEYEFRHNSSNNRPIAENKKLMKSLYLKIDTFFENLVRDNHGRNSAKEILDRKALNFIEETVREMVSQVSLAHAMNECDVYKVKSVASNHIISLKFLKILLRLSDVLDMGNNRVSNLLLSHNLDNMNKDSRFHWLSHSITNEYRVETSYRIINKELSDKGLFMDHNICEKIIITVPVNLFQFTKCEKPQFTDYPSFYVSKLEKNQIEISFNTLRNNCSSCSENKKCNQLNGSQESENCVFLFKWFSIKNKFLIKEFFALQEYLQSIPNNMFLTKIIIRVKSENPEVLDKKQFSYLKSYVDETN